EGTSETGAAILVAVRMGIKIYHTNIASPSPDVEVSNFEIEKENGTAASLKLYVDNTGNGWLDGKIHYDLLNQDTGDKYKLEETEFFSLPGDKRLFIQNLPKEMAKGNYTATALIRLSKDNIVKVAELTFK